MERERIPKLKVDWLYTQRNNIKPKIMLEGSIHVTEERNWSKSPVLHDDDDLL
jgi:hypothetical protein